ncbi:hypothetical protein C8F04DRAFT_90106 [Mycena alexandri]|uniref:Uncharacterized protein n=1 Tax=Mycena alexandri TaxID=1745969 RepID=A0AAD6SGG0_9AGAR|nr:hypothetical protein C8F04DRAFT_90106 [Mycena alexandri]
MEHWKCRRRCHHRAFTRSPTWHPMFGSVHDPPREALCVIPSASDLLRPRRRQEWKMPTHVHADLATRCSLAPPALRWGARGESLFLRATRGGAAISCNRGPLMPPGDSPSGRDQSTRLYSLIHSRSGVLYPRCWHVRPSSPRHLLCWRYRHRDMSLTAWIAVMPERNFFGGLILFYFRCFPCFASFRSLRLPFFHSSRDRRELVHPARAFLGTTASLSLFGGVQQLPCLDLSGTRALCSRRHIARLFGVSLCTRT